MYDIRLIDAKALAPRTTSEICLENYGEVLFVGKSEIDKAPTIDAIPVAWLEQQFYDNPKSQWAEKCRDVYTKWQKWQRWQKEQEAR